MRLAEDRGLISRGPRRSHAIQICVWRDGYGDLAGRLEIPSGGRRQLVMRLGILVVQISVNDHLIAEPFVIEVRKPTVVFDLG